jgi:hypothetical protein
MRPFWQSSFGKLVIGGCGAQIGLLITLGGLVLALAFCAVCVVTNVVSLGLARELVQTSAPSAPNAAPSSPAEVGSLLEQVESLLIEVESLQLDQPEQLPPPPPPAGGKSVVMAGKNSVSLYSGPGIDFDQVAILPAGESLEIVGRNSSSTWWLVALPEGRFAWAFNALVVALNVNDTIPVVTTPSELGQPASFAPPAGALPTLPPPPAATPTPALPPGTPTPGAEASRQFVEELSSYQRVKASFLVPPVSASLSPDGTQIAMTERIKVYTIGTAGAHTDIWLEDNNQLGPLGWVVWSPNGNYIAFVVGFKIPKCRPCESVALLHLSDGAITFLEAPNSLNTDAPRWTQDGRLLVNVHAGEPADGVAYVYDVYGQGQQASGVYWLSASHEGQKWFPWRPGRVWRAGASERPDSYVNDE